MNSNDFERRSSDFLCRCAQVIFFAEWTMQSVDMLSFQVSSRRAKNTVEELFPSTFSNAILQETQLGWLNTDNVNALRWMLMELQ